MTALGTPWVLTWKMVEGVKTAKARLVARGFRDPDVEDGDVASAGSVGLPSSHLQFISLGVLNKWPIWSPGIENAFRRAGGFDREVYLRALRERNSEDDRRVWRLRAPAYGPSDEPSALARVFGGPR